MNELINYLIKVYSTTTRYNCIVWCVAVVAAAAAVVAAAAAAAAPAEGT